MQNLQNIPTQTDVDQPMPDDRAPSEESRLERRDYPVPPDKQPSAPVSEPPNNQNQKPINENQNETPRLMSSYTAAQRRIF